VKKGVDNWVGGHLREKSNVVLLGERGLGREMVATAVMATENLKSCWHFTVKPITLPPCPSPKWHKHGALAFCRIS